MKTISVDVSKKYSVLVGTNILDGLGKEIEKVSKAAKIAIISDSHVWPLYGNVVLKSLEKSGFKDTVHFVFEAGEQSKTGEVFLQALEFLAENKMTRSDCIIALGGGVVGDLTGFVAASYLRGIDYVQIPTTLLACVDSSVGGKTAIDLHAGKNLAGAFYQPKLVLCDIETLKTLPKDIFRDGCAEVIKYGILYDPELFSHLKEHGMDFDKEWVISRCVALKRDVVKQDEFDMGSRQKLNLGHTVGHGIEANSNYTVSHGQAVAMGMAIVSRAGVRFGICQEATCDSIHSILMQFGLPTRTEFNAEAIYRVALSDKKRSADEVNLIIPESIGNCRIHPIAISELKAYIDAGL